MTEKSSGFSGLYQDGGEWSGGFMKRVKAARQSLVKESQIQSAIEDYLRLMERGGRLAYIKNNTGAYKTERGGYVRFGRAGSSDFLLFLHGGGCIHLEVKTSSGRQSKSQKEYQQMMEGLGHRYLVVRSVAEVAALFDGTGASLEGSRQPSRKPLDGQLDLF